MAGQRVEDRLRLFGEEEELEDNCEDNFELHDVVSDRRFQNIRFDRAGTITRSRYLSSLRMLHKSNRRGLDKPRGPQASRRFT